MKKKVLLPILALVLALGLAFPLGLQPTVALADGTCTLTVNFPGMSGVNVQVKVDDGNDGTANGGLVTYKNNNSKSVTFTLLTNCYDVVVDAPGTGNDRIDDCVLVTVIDIKPGSDPNAINPKSKGVIPVAILGQDAFDFTRVDVTTLDFEGAAPAHDLTDPIVYADHLQDVNGDGYVDLVCHFNTQDTGIEKGHPEACLEFEIDTVLFRLCDAIKTVGK